MYENVKKKLKEAGEVMIKVSTGETFELHIHNTKFNDAEKEIFIDTNGEKYWINGNEIVYYWIHLEGPEEKS